MTSIGVLLPTPISIVLLIDRMSKLEEVRHGIARCEHCGAIQPVEVRPDEDLSTLGNPTCECGSNAFRLIE